MVRKLRSSSESKNVGILPKSDASKLDLPDKVTRSKKSLKESSILSSCDTPFVVKSGNTNVGIKSNCVVESCLKNKPNSASDSSAIVEKTVGTTRSRNTKLVIPKNNDTLTSKVAASPRKLKNSNECFDKKDEGAGRTTRSRNTKLVIPKNNDTLTSKVADFHEVAASPRKLKNSNKCFDKKDEGVLNNLTDVSAKAANKTKKNSSKQNSLSGQQLISRQKSPQIKNASKNKIDDYDVKVSDVFQKKSGGIMQTKLSSKKSDDDDDWEDVSSDECSDFLVLDSTSLRKCGRAEKVVGKKIKRKEKLSTEKKSRKMVRDANEVHPVKESDPDYEVEMKDSSSDSDETDDWEEVPVTCQASPKKRKLQPVEFTVSKKHGSKKSKIEQAMDEIRRRINRKLIISQYNLHKTHLLCLLSIGFRMNSIGSIQCFRGCLLSLVPIKLLTKSEKKSAFSLDLLVETRDWFLKKFPLKLQLDHRGYARLKLMSDVIMGMKKCNLSELEYILVFVALCRSMGFNARIVCSLQPSPYKPTDTLKSKPLSAAFLQKMSLKTDEDFAKEHAAAEVKKQMPTKFKDISEPEMEKAKCPKKPARACKKPKMDKILESHENVVDDEDESDDDFDDDDKPRKRKTGHGRKKNAQPKRMKCLDASSMNSKSIRTKNNSKNQDGLCDWWAEIYLESMSSWITVAGPSLELNKTNEVEKRLTKPISYILAFTTDNYVKDLTRKYDSNWLKATSKARLDEPWWNETLKYFADDASDESLEEDLQIHDVLLKKPFPTSIAEYKNHPLYALQRHLLKYEAIYPSNAPVLGKLKEEPIFARECVHTLCSREKWLIEGRMILPYQEPYKYVKALPRSNKQRTEANQMLGLFGLWQTEIYVASPARDGMVPKNSYGNVDLFKPWMLPQGTVHLKGTYYGMGKAARKAGIDAAPAMVGWEFHKGMNHPILDGWVVCKENAEALLDSWKKEQELEKERVREKREKRITDNWRRLIKHLLIRHRLISQFRTITIKEAAQRKPFSCKREDNNSESDSESCSSFQTVSELSTSSNTSSGNTRKSRKTTATAAAKKMMTTKK